MSPPPADLVDEAAEEATAAVAVTTAELVVEAAEDAVEDTAAAVTAAGDRPEDAAEGAAPATTAEEVAGFVLERVDGLVEQAADVGLVAAEQAAGEVTDVAEVAAEQVLAGVEQSTEAESHLGLLHSLEEVINGRLHLVGGGDLGVERVDGFWLGRRHDDLRLRFGSGGRGRALDRCRRRTPGRR